MSKWANNSTINLKVAGLCFLIAATFWFFQAMSKNHTSVVSFDLEVRYDPRTLIQVEPPTSTLQLNVSGYGWNLFFKKLGFSKDVLFINASDCPRIDYLRGPQVTKLINDQLEDVDVNYVVTDTVFLHLDHSASKEVRLVIDQSKFEEGVVLNSSVDILPNIVHLSGPEKLLSTLDDPYPVNVNKLNQGHSLRSYKLKLAAVFGDQINSEEDEVLISVEASKFVTRNILVPIEQLNFPEGQSTEDKLSVSYVSDVEHPLKEDQLHIVADYQTYRRSDSTVRVQLLSRPKFVKKLVPAQKRLKVTYAN